MSEGVALDPERIRQIVYDGLAPVPVYAEGIGKTVRTVWSWISEGLPVTYIGPTPYVRVLETPAWFASRKSKRRADVAEHTARRGRGRPRKPA